MPLPIACETIEEMLSGVKPHLHPEEMRIRKELKTLKKGEKEERVIIELNDDIFKIGVYCPDSNQNNFCVEFRMKKTYEVMEKLMRMRHEDGLIDQLQKQLIEKLFSSIETKEVSIKKLSIHTDSFILESLKTKRFIIDDLDLSTLDDPCAMINRLDSVISRSSFPLKALTVPYRPVHGDWSEILNCAERLRICTFKGRDYHPLFQLKNKHIFIDAEDFTHEDFVNFEEDLQIFGRPGITYAFPLKDEKEALQISRMFEALAYSFTTVWESDNLREIRESQSDNNHNGRTIIKLIGEPGYEENNIPLRECFTWTLEVELVAPPF